MALLPVFYTIFVTWATRAASLSKATKGIYAFASYFLAILYIGYIVNWVSWNTPLVAPATWHCCRQARAPHLHAPAR